jgi:molybdopterin synthase sulfur carrier subunit
MAEIRVLFFASLRESLPVAELQWPLPEPTTVAALRAALRAQGADWAPLDNNLMMAVNQTLVQADAEVNPGDEVAFFPPVTGG